ncbi:MAG: hypothetical protein PHD48_07850 [Alphaproteobacteria bacterium]|nr:hypothetical protein [Alphaproteobacteria bacterium]
MSSISGFIKTAKWACLSQIVAGYSRSEWFHQTLAVLPPAPAMTAKLALGLGFATCLAMGGLEIWDMVKATRPTELRGPRLGDKSPTQR